jgi:hypothetical protein
MRSDRVVVLSPLLDDDLCFLQAVEDFAIQQLIAETLFGYPCIPAGDLGRLTLTHCDFNLAKQCHNLLRAKPLLRHDQAPFQDSFSQNAWSKKARSGQGRARVCDE